MLKHNYLIFVFVITFSITFAQKWENPANKYINSYKAYLSAACPIQKDNIKHFVYFAKDRHSIKTHPFLKHQAFYGAQIMYSWRQLEPEKDKYDFSIIEEDITYLRQYGKKLFIQLQDVTFYIKNNPVPKYLRTDEYGGGSVLQYENKRPVGWVAKRWNVKVQERFFLLLKALGERFDGEIEGINLQETAIGVEPSDVPDYTTEAYINGVKTNMLSLKKAFPNTTTMVYANFMPGEWLPWEDKGYLKSIYAYGEDIGVGLGAPDLMVTRKGQLNHALAQMHENNFTVPLGVAVQDGNYIGKTGADLNYNETNDKGENRNSIVPLLHAFAKGFLKVDYMFWVNQKPYFEEDVLPCFSN